MNPIYFRLFDGYAAGILQGTSGTTLSPKDTTTVEQAILLTLRAYQEFIA